MKIDVFTDGSATVVTKPGGLAYVLVVDGQTHSEGYGHLDLASNNDAELEAAIQGLAAAFKLIVETGKFALINDPNAKYEVTLCSDSQIVLGWTDGTYRFKQKEKQHKFAILKELSRRLDVKTRWIKGHAGNEHNERCDKLAKLGRKGEEKKIQAAVEIKKNSKIGLKLDGVAVFWYHGIMKIVDLRQNVVEDYDKDVHGNRSSKMEIR